MSEPTDVQIRLIALFDEIQNPKFDSKNPHFRNRYASLNSVLGVLPVVRRHGFEVRQTTEGYRQGECVFCSRLEDRFSGAIAREVFTPFVLKEESPQAVGSSLTYYRRYGLLLLLNLVGEEDDDAEAAMGRGKKDW